MAPSHPFGTLSFQGGTACTSDLEIIVEVNDFPSLSEILSDGQIASFANEPFQF